MSKKETKKTRICHAWKFTDREVSGTGEEIGYRQTGESGEKPSEPAADSPQS
ncbi:MAG TPA: hypothetical protein VLH40_06280 [Atribacteraceae bacterium]|nr:hypothetical protein [Atribacteraceae bacterium]